MRGLIQRLSAWPAYRWVCVMLVVYFVAALFGTWINYISLHLNSVGIYDLSINQQALSSTIHSNQPYPFYEATNCGRDDRCSFLLVHPTFIGYLVAIPYAFAPSAFTLFAIQDAALALAALPLFAIARQVTKSVRLSIVVAGAYLVWLPAFSGIFSFHWEAFIPVEYFTIFWLWMNRRYWLAVPVVLLSFVTIEIVPVLVFFLAAYFLVPWFLLLGKLFVVRLRILVSPQGKATPKDAASLRSTREALRKVPGVGPTLGLLVGSAAAYVALHLFVTNGGGLFGLPPLPTAYMIPLTQPVHAADFTLGNLHKAWSAKLLFWVVMFATLAMLPFLSPRSLVLSVPWIVFSLFATAGYYRMGNQYAFISAAVMFVGFVYGVAWMKRWVEGPHDWWQSYRTRRAKRLAARQEERSAARRAVEASSAPVLVPGATLAGEPPRKPAGTEIPPPTFPAVSPMTVTELASPPSVPVVVAEKPRIRSALPSPEGIRRGRRRRARVVLGVVLTGVIVFNLFLNPLNPLAANFKTQEPFASQAPLGLDTAYNLSAYHHLEQLISFMGNRAIVGVSPALFTIFANDPYSYPLISGMNYSYLPFNASAATQNVVLLDHSGTVLPSFLMKTLYNASIFGVRAWIPATYLGGVLLFQRGYTGLTQVLGSAPTFTGGTFTANAGLLVGSNGTVRYNETSYSGWVITAKSVPGHDATADVGRVFGGPRLALSAGSYQAKIVVYGNITKHNPHEYPPYDPSVVILRVAGFECIISAPVHLLLSAFKPDNGWIVTTINFTLAYPVLGVSVLGVNLRSWFNFFVDYVTITPLVAPSSDDGTGA